MPSDELQDDYAVVFGGGGAFAAWEVGAYEAIFSRYRHKPPSIVTGASAGALNAAALCAGMGIDELKRLWNDLTREDVCKIKISYWDFLRALSHCRGSLTKSAMYLLERRDSLMETSPLRDLVDSNFRPRIEPFLSSPMSCVLTVTELKHGRSEFYFKRSNKNITEKAEQAWQTNRTDHWHPIRSLDTLRTALMGSTAIPILFPPSQSGAYFDGGILLNQPIAAARGLGALVIYVLNPNASRLGITDDIIKIGNTLLSTWMSISLRAEIGRIKEENWIHRYLNTDSEMIKLCHIEPSEDLQARHDGTHLLSFGSKVSDLIDDGYKAANSRLNTFKLHNSSTWDSNPDDLSGRRPTHILLRDALADREAGPVQIFRGDQVPKQQPEPDDSDVY